MNEDVTVNSVTSSDKKVSETPDAAYNRRLKTFQDRKRVPPPTADELSVVQYTVLLLDKGYHPDIIKEELKKRYPSVKPEKVDLTVDEHVKKLLEQREEDPVVKISKKLDERERVVNEDDPMMIIRRAYSDIHAGDHEIAESIILGFCCTRELTNSGIQPKGSGRTGVGKTASFESAVYLLPQNCTKIGTLSNKSLFYNKTLKDGMVFLIDDASLSDEMVSVIKSATSRFQENTFYSTVTRNRDGVLELPIPKRCMFLFTAVDDIGDEQLSNRFFQCSLFRDNEALNKISDFYKGLDRDGLALHRETENVRTCRAMLEKISNHTFIVKVPFTDRIEWNTNDIRLQREFMTILKAHAVLYYQHRNHTSLDDQEVIIEATEDDFHYVYQMSLFKNKDVAEGRYTDTERTIIKMLHELRPKHLQDQDWTVMQKQLVELGVKYNIKPIEVSYALRGRLQNGKRSPGLDTKINGLVIEDLTHKHPDNLGDGEIEMVRGNRIRVPKSLKNTYSLESSLGIARLIN